MPIRHLAVTALSALIASISCLSSAERLVIARVIPRHESGLIDQCSGHPASPGLIGGQPPTAVGVSQTDLVTLR